MHPGIRKLTDTQALEIRTMFRDGSLQKSIAKIFGVNQTNISSIVTGRSYVDAPWPLPIASSPRKSLPKFPGYEFDSDGNAYSFKNNKKYGRKLKLQPDEKGYWMVAVTDEHGKQFLLRVNRLICTLFHGPQPTFSHQARHLNGIKTDNRAVNLAWGTQKENETDKIRHGTKPLGENKHNAILTEANVKEIRSSDKSSRELAKQYGVSQPAIHSARIRITWKHVE